MIARDTPESAGALREAVNQMAKTNTTDDTAHRRRAYTVRETQKILKVSRATLYRMFREGRLASIKIGSCRRITDDAIDAVLGGEAA